MRQLWSEVLIIAVWQKWSFSKISLAIPDGFAWWRENQILQVEAHLVVPFLRPGKIVQAFNLLFEDSSVTPNVARWLDNMACSDASNSLYNATASKSCTKSATPIGGMLCYTNMVFSKISLQILMVARFKTISYQGASASESLVFRKICFRVELVL